MNVSQVSSSTIGAFYTWNPMAGVTDCRREYIGWCFIDERPTVQGESQPWSGILEP